MSPEFMPRDWGLKWKRCFIAKFTVYVMNKAVIAIIAVVIVGGISAYALAPYFTESIVDEALPTGAIVQPTTDDKESVMMMEEEEKMQMMEEEEKMQMMEEEEKMQMMEEEEKMQMMEEEEKMQMMEEEEKMQMMEEEEKMQMMEDKEMIVPVSYSGKFIGVGDGIHDAQGDTYTIPLEDGSNVLRLENFQSTNGPDLYVYLSTDDYASEFVNLGELKANKGNQNYEIPDNTDLDKYNKVLIWCKAFGVLFGSAELSSN